MIKLQNLTARLHRETPKEHMHMTLFGKQQLKTFTCVVCGSQGFFSEAYMQSKHRRKHDYDIRPYHAECYIKTNGKFKETPSKLHKIIADDNEPRATLERFLVEPI
jgi:hypothetical protein